MCLARNEISFSSFAIANHFSRKIINNVDNVYHHYGVYLYKYSVLEKYVNLKQSDNEKKESLEQLRALDNNISIHVILAKHYSVGIDTKQDIDNYKKFTN